MEQTIGGTTATATGTDAAAADEGAGVSDTAAERGAVGSGVEQTGNAQSRMMTTFALLLQAVNGQQSE